MRILMIALAAAMWFGMVVGSLGQGQYGLTLLFLLPLLLMAIARSLDDLER